MECHTSLKAVPIFFSSLLTLEEKWWIKLYFRLRRWLSRESTCFASMKIWVQLPRWPWNVKCGTVPLTSVLRAKDRRILGIEWSARLLSQWVRFGERTLLKKGGLRWGEQQRKAPLASKCRNRHKEKMSTSEWFNQLWCHPYHRMISSEKERTI